MHVAAVFLSFTLALYVSAGHAVTIGGNPGPEHNYVCPHSDGQPAVECYFDAVQHLYTMCRNVKSIEVIEFGYEKSLEGTNSAKSESCLDKQKLNIAQPFAAALKQAKQSKQPKQAVEGLNELQKLWLAAMTELRWHDGESDDQYKARVTKPYADFTERIETIRTVLVVEPPAKAAPAKAAPAKSKPRKTTPSAKPTSN
jgi:hypothetical protein